MTVLRSAPGLYRGYSEVVADGYVRTSRYVEAKDGCRLAVDVLLPARGGVALSGPFPAGFIGTGYRRAWRKAEREFGTAAARAAIAHVPTGTVVTAWDYNAVARSLIQHGYAIVVLDIRGTGASFGKPIASGWEQGRDIAHIVDWAGRQPWCNGRVGMFGASWLGINSICTAAARPEHLKCIAPFVPPTQYNPFIYAGLLMHGFINDWSDMREGQDVAEVALAVDGADGPAELRSALGERGNLSYLRMTTNEFTLDRYEVTLGRQSPDLADSFTGRLGATLTEFDRIDAAGVPIYFMTGWWDLAYVDDTISLYSSLTVPKRLMLGPWNHISFSAAVETRRWFDHFLRDIDNGVTTEAPITYCTWNPNGPPVWRAARQWPIADARVRPLYFARPDSATPTGVDGSLERARPHDTKLTTYRVDYAVTTGDHSRHRHGYRTMTIALPDLDARARACASWTTPPIDAAFDITGTAVLHVRLASTHTDGGLVAVLEDLSPDGIAHYVTEGVLNLEDRALAVPPFPRASGAWHPTETALRAPLPVGTPVDVAFELWAVSWHVAAGHRLRITLAGADKDNYTVPVREPAPLLTIHNGGPRASFLALPVIAMGAHTVQPIAEAFADDPIKAPFAIHDSSRSTA